VGHAVRKYGISPGTNGLGAREKITWRRSAVDISCTPGWPCPETFAQKAEKEARGKALLVREEEIAEQLWNKAFTPKAQNATEAIQQLRLFYDAIEKFGSYDLKLNYSLQTSLYAPHVNLPGHWGVSWGHLQEKGQLAAKPYGYIPKFFPNILVAPHGYQTFGYLLRDLIFHAPRMKASAVAQRAKKVQEYLTAIPADLGDFEGYNSAVMEWAKDLSVAPSTFDKRVDRLILLLKAWDGVPWPHPWFGKFLPAPEVPLPPFKGGYQFNDPSLVLTDYFPTTVENIQGDIAFYLTTVQEEWEEHFGILLNEKIEKLKAKIKAKEKAIKVMKWYFLVISLMALAAGAPAVFKLIVIKIPKAVFNFMALKKMNKEELRGTKDIFGLIEMTEDNLVDMRLWIGSKATLPPVLPPAPGGEGQYSLFIQEIFIGRSDATEELVNYAVLTGRVGDKVEIGDEYTNLPVGIGLITKEGIEWIPENVAGNFQNLGDSETRSLAASLVGGDEGIPWWLIGIPIAFVVAAT